MFSKLEKIEEKYENLNQQLCSIDISKQLDLHKSIMKELKNLNPIVEEFRNYKSLKKNLDECEEILESKDSDSELKEMAELEIQDFIAPERPQR